MVKFLAVAARNFVCFACLLSAGAHAASIWIAEEKTLYRIDTLANAFSQTWPVKSAEQLASDGMGNVWVVSDKRLFKFSEQGAQLLDLDINALGGDSNSIIAVNAYDNSLWLLGENRLVHLDADGNVLGSFAMPDNNATALFVALDQTVWLQRESMLQHYSAQGALLSTSPFGEEFSQGKLKRLDSVSKVFWTAKEKSLFQVSADAPTQVNFSRTLADPAFALALDEADGTLWVLTKKQILGFSHSGTLLKTITLSTLNVGEVEALIFDSGQLGLWLAHKRGLVRFDANGALIAQVPTPSAIGNLEIKSYASSPLGIVPTVKVLAPANGALLNNAMPTFLLEYGAVCSGLPCGFSPNTFGSYSLSALLNAAQIGTLFTFDPATGRSSFTPSTPLPQGVNAFSTQVQNLFGIPSINSIASFTIDTVAPQFLNVIPPTGSVFTVDQLAIRGQTDDPTASVFFTSYANWNGLRTNPATQNFNFQITLKPGANAINLTATDPTGNSTPLRLDYIYQPLAVTISTPMDGASVATNNISVTGSFVGVAGTTITVQGLPASITGQNYVIDSVPLVFGANSIVVTATAPNGTTATHTITVTSTLFLNRPPTVSILSPSAGTKYVIPPRPAINIRMNAADPDGNLFAVIILAYRDSVDGTLATALGALPGQDGVYQADWNDIGPGNYYLVARAYDAEGLSTDSTAVFVQVMTKPPPTIAISAPANNVQVANSTVAVSGTFANAVRIVVTDACDSVAIVGNSFSVANVKLAYGNNAITATASNDDGSTAIQTINVFANIPTISFSSPANNTQAQSASVVISGVYQGPANSTISVNGQEVIARGSSFGAVVPLTYGDNLITAQLSTPDGKTAIRSINVNSTLGAIAISDPMPGATVDANRINVSGSFQGTTATQVTVNGVQATIGINSTFIARNITLNTGDNIITVIAVTPGKPTVTKVFTITSTGLGAIQYSVSPTSGYAPMKVNFSATHLLGFTISKIEVDFNGDGVFDAISTNIATPVAYIYTSPGSYAAVVRVTDIYGTVYSKTVSILAKDGMALDQTIRTVWNNWKAALAAGDKVTALTYMNDSAKDRYGFVLDVLLSRMTGITASFSDIKQVGVSDGFAEYAITRINNGKKSLFLVYFLQNPDGTWLIDSM